MNTRFPLSLYHTRPHYLVLDFVEFFRIPSRSLVLQWVETLFHFTAVALPCVCVSSFSFSFFFLIIYIRHRIFHLLGSSELLSFESFASSFSIASSNRVGCWKFSSPFQFFLSIISLVIPYYLFVVLNLVLCVHWSIPVYRCVFGFILVRYTLLQ